jgi:hypothetical protein
MALPYVEARDFYPELAEVGKEFLKDIRSGLSTCMETLPRPISMRSHNKTASKNRLREGRSWGNDLAARPAMTMLKGLGLREKRAIKEGIEKD